MVLMRSLSVVLVLPKINNPRVRYGILEIALELPGGHSAKLKPKVIEGTRVALQFLEHRYRDLLVHWTAVKRRRIGTSKSTRCI